MPSRFKNKRQVIQKITCSGLIGISVVITLAVLGGTQPDIKRFFHSTDTRVYAADDKPKAEDKNTERPKATITGQDSALHLVSF